MRTLSDQELERCLAEVETQGFTLLESVIPLDLVDELNRVLLRLESELSAQPGCNLFEGHHTIRIYNLLARDPVFQRVPVFPALLPIVEGVLDKGALISSLSSISIDPGERAQPIHADDALIKLPRPHPAVVCNSMWALTDFTEANGATRIVPGSHRFDTKPEYGSHPESIPAEMPKGSILVWNGSLWHGGGANRSDHRRVGIAMNYCAGFIRQQENQQLGIPLSLVRSFEPRLQELAGFGTYSNLMGHIDKRSPSQVLLERDDGFRSVWDLIEATDT
jgi:ectoine hydroxylase-related dioxygenase (phytanoyl-CoA dioxygenase family)